MKMVVPVFTVVHWTGNMLLVSLVWNHCGCFILISRLLLASGFVDPSCTVEYVHDMELTNHDHHQSWRGTCVQLLSTHRWVFARSLSRKSAGYIIIANAQDFLEPQFPICELKIIDLRQYGIAVWFMCCGILLVQICSIESYLPTYTNMLFSSCSVIESIINDQPNPAILRLRLTTSHSSELFFLPSP